LPEAPSISFASEDVPPAAPQPSAASYSADSLQEAVVEALSSAKSQGTAADAIADAEFTLAGTELTIQTGVSKMMLPTVINPDAEKIVRNAILAIAPGLQIKLEPGAAKATAAKKPRAAKSGSVQARALEHPVVQEAQRLFNAEIRNVIDLSSNE
jgi:DNA polymerase III subunit gamma/tau